MELNKFSISERSKLLVITVTYVILIIYNYIYYLTPVWEYQGFPEFNVEKGTGPLMLAIISCILFSAVYPRSIVVYSRFVVWFIFFFIYTPSVIIVTMQGFPQDSGYTLVIFLTISLFTIAYFPEFLLNIKKLQKRYVSINNYDEIHMSLFKNKLFTPPFERLIIFLFVLFMVSLSLFFSDIITAVDIANVYEHRELVQEYTPNKTIQAYAFQWLVRVLIPLVIAIGLLFEKKALLILGLIGAIISFFMSGAKFIIFFIPLIILFYRFVIKKSVISANDIGLLMTTILFLFLLLIELYGHEVESYIGLVLSQVVKRAFSINGMTLGNYYDFFINSNNPFTYYSHLGPISYVVDYPYENYAIGQVVGYYQAGAYSYDMSAGFWSTDGIAAGGYGGILIIGFILGFLLSMFNYFSRACNFRLLCLGSIGCIWMLADTSIFRVVLTGGWPIILILVHFYSRSMDKWIKIKC